MRIGFKLVLVAVMTVLILIPLAMVNGLIGERQRYRDEAVADIGRMYASPQTVSGPVLTVPYTETVDAQEIGSDGAVRTVRKRQTFAWTFFPTRLDASGTVATSTRSRGLYHVPVYEWAGAVKADFDVEIPADVPGADRIIGTPVLGYGVADVRGMHGTPKLVIDGRDVALLEGAGVREDPGVHAVLAAPASDAHFALRTQLDLKLAGTQSLAFVPLGKQNRIDLKSTWPHPSFQGLSPWQSEISDTGFHAQWQVASIATDAQRQYLSRQPSYVATPSGMSTARDVTLPTLGVLLDDPVDAYTLADRATKYGVLFVAITFVGFFMFEVIRQLPIHPIQYGLVGLALVIFFLLLVSLSEHIPFPAAYATASGACIGLIGFYLSAVLRSALRGTAFAATLGLLYAALYGLLISEDNALVLGSLLLFAILAAIMIATRRLDWYRVGGQLASSRTI
ncbi:cell envelope integrity protein CreD [Cognatilysobacter terrigena]|uniref:cell envelope integrity protein CreD n=1 Tax=Cognatilysobacter terrigena TaxID=2488749 RepID=UPI00105F51E2|nr:cell envelope integrity protein CreD [Lysobacter terrigena]